MSGGIRQPELKMGFEDERSRPRELKGGVSLEVPRWADGEHIILPTTGLGESEG